MGEVSELLKTLGMSEYAERFAENDIDESVLPHLTDHDLIQLGLSLGHRRRLLATIAGWPPQPPSSQAAATPRVDIHSATGSSTSQSTTTERRDGKSSTEKKQAPRGAVAEDHLTGITFTAFELIANPVLFFFLYLFFVIPTYILPYFGSNSLLIGGVISSAAGSNPLFWIHVLCFACLAVITWWRGYASNVAWITVFPVIAGIFDLVPGFTLFFLLPTLMHVLAVVFGVKGKIAQDPTLAEGFGVRFLVGLVVIALMVFAVGVSFAIVNSAKLSAVASVTQPTQVGTTTNTKPEPRSPTEQLTPTKPSQPKTEPRSPTEQLTATKPSHHTEADPPRHLGEPEIFFSGVRFIAASAAGNVKYWMSFKPDGTLTREPFVDSVGSSSSGSWRQSKDGFCTTFAGSKENCYTLRRAGNGKWEVLFKDVVIAAWMKPT